jgi:hypothetical protein
MGLLRKWWGLSVIQRDHGSLAKAHATPDVSRFAAPAITRGAASAQVVALDRAHDVGVGERRSATDRGAPAACRLARRAS